MNNTTDNNNGEKKVTKLQDLPHSILVNIVQKVCGIEELLELRLVSSILKNAVDDEEVWFDRIKHTFQIDLTQSYLHEVGRKKSYKMLFRALQNPEVFVWGASGNSRLGFNWEELRALIPPYGWGEAEAPLKLSTLSGKGVSKIICGGWMMLCLTHTGSVYFWGTFNPEVWNGDESSTIQTPKELDLFKGESIQQLVCGRAHAAALSHTGSLYELSSPTSSTQIPINSKIKQIAAGWSFTLALLEDNTLIKWEQGPEKNRKFNKLHADLNEGEKFTKLGGGRGFSMALTTESRVFYWMHPNEQHNEADQIEEDTDDEEDFDEDIYGDEDVYDEEGIYEEEDVDDVEDIDDEEDFNNDIEDVGGFEEEDILREPAEVFHTITSLESFSLDHEERGHQLVGFPSSASAITHLNVHFLKFGLMTVDGDIWFGQYSEDPIPILQLLNTQYESLQHQGVCQVSFGDWHQAALLDNGQLYTWGEHGLGHGKLFQSIETPKLVEHFADKYFVFYLSCAGWHTAALAVKIP